MQEMSAAWQMTVDMHLGLFSRHAPETSPLASSESNIPKPNPPFVAPHNIWIKVSVGLYNNKNTYPVSGFFEDPDYLS